MLEDAAFARNVRGEYRPIDDDRRRQKDGPQDVARLERQSDLGRRRDRLAALIRDVQAAEDEANRLPHSAPFQENVFGADRELARGCIELLRHMLAQEVEVYRGKQQARTAYGDDHSQNGRAVAYDASDAAINLSDDQSSSSAFLTIAAELGKRAAIFDNLTAVPSPVLAFDC
jgi:hypothetical protein